MTEFQITDPLNHPNWDALWAEHPDYSFFHSAAWARVLCESYHYRPAYLMGTVELGGERAPSALIPLMEINSRLTGKRGVSLPFSDYCEPIVRQEASFEEALHYLMQHGKQSGWETLEVRGGKHFPSGTIPSSHYYVHTLSLQPDAEKMFAGFTSATQRNIKKAGREGVEVRLEHSQTAVQEFYRLNGLTRRDHGLPSQPFSFFQRIYDHVICQKQGFIALAYHRREVIAGAVYFCAGEKGYYKYGASHKKFQSLRANNLVMWEAIQHLAKNGCTRLCLGRTDLSQEGLRQYKLGWAPHEETIHYYKYDLLQDTYLSEPASHTAWQNPLVHRVPVPVLNRIGSLLYRHMG